MAQWRSLSILVQDGKIDPKRLHAIIGHRMCFPMDFREKFATWIESQEWEDQPEDHKRKYDEILQMMQSKLNELQPIKKIDFQSAIENFQERYEGDYDQFCNMINTILVSERSLMQSINQNTDDPDERRFDVAQENPQIVQGIAKFRGMLKNNEVELKQLEAMQEQDQLKLTELKDKIRHEQKNLQADSMELKKEMELVHAEYNKIINNLQQKQERLVLVIHNSCTELYRIMQLVWEEVDDFKEDQRLACTMLRKPKDNIMDVLDRTCEAVGDMLVRVLQQQQRLIHVIKLLISKGISTGQCLEVALNHQQVMKLRRNQHLNKVFLVENNIPKQVLKVSNKKSPTFSMTVRLLGGVSLGLNVNQPQVSVSLYPEKQIMDVMKFSGNMHDMCIPEGCCEIENALNKPFEYIRNGSFRAQFNTMMLKRMKREAKGRHEDFVTDHKHAFIFFTTAKILNENIMLKALSLPIVITSQTSQECMARGTIIWSAAFLKPEEERKTQFDSYEEVAWKDVAKVLCALFKEHTSRPLSADHLKHLAQVAFREKHDLDFNKMSISRQYILKDKLPNRDFPFWRWLMCCLNSIKESLIAEWKEGLIYGFISKDEAEQKLKKHNCGTFLIRFSESTIERAQSADISGYLTVAVTERNPRTGKIDVFHIKQNLDPRNLRETRLAATLAKYEIDDYSRPSDSQDSKSLLEMLWTPQKLYPFKEAFSKYIEVKDTRNKDGYIGGESFTKISLDSYPRRRQSQNQPDNIWSPTSTVAPSPAASELSEMSRDESPPPDLNTSTFPQFTLQPLSPLVCKVPPLNHTSPNDQYISAQPVITMATSDNLTPPNDQYIPAQPVVTMATSDNPQIDSFLDSLSTHLAENDSLISEYFSNVQLTDQSFDPNAFISQPQPQPSAMYIMTDKDGDIMLTE